MTDSGLPVTAKATCLMLSFLSSPLEGREYGMKIAWIKIAHAVEELGKKMIQGTHKPGIL